jgi:hypothetical protein
MSAENAVRTASRPIVISSAINAEPFDSRAIVTRFRERASTAVLIRRLKSPAGGMMVIKPLEPYNTTSLAHNEKRTNMFGNKRGPHASHPMVTYALSI